MGRAWIGGKPAALERAVAEAARLLSASRSPLIAGLGTDIAGARAAIGLAERIGAVVDHMNSDMLLRDLAVLREAGMMLITPNEARLRADTLMLVGPGPEAAAPELGQSLELSRKGDAAARRAIVRLCPGRAATAAPGDTMVGRDPDDLPVLLAALRARVAGRPVGKIVGIPPKAIDDVATRLKAARFGVAIWSPADLDALAIEMLCGLVADLNGQTRFTGFSIAPGDNAVGVLQACGWMTGFPMRTGFGRGDAEHDPWRFDAARMIADREADCLLWISAYRAAPSPHNGGPPMIALTAGDAMSGRHTTVQIEIGQPGVDHDAVEHCAALGTLVAVTATRPTETTSAADAIARILAALPESAQ